MAHVTVLGAGLVAGPVVRHILESSEHTVAVAARNVERAKALVNGHPRGRAVSFDISDPAALDRIVAESDVVVAALAAFATTTWRWRRYGPTSAAP